MTVIELYRQLEGLSDLDKSRRIVDLLDGHAAFEALAHKEGLLLEERDREDGYKLKEGIDIARKKGLIPEEEGEITWARIHVDGKLPGAIFEEIMRHSSFDKPGTVLAISGDSGVGKGTLVDELLSRIEDSEKWSNGDIFRILTYFALQENPDLLRYPESLADKDFSAICSRIHIEEEGDIRVELPGGLKDLDEIKNNLLKETSINRALPSVARFTQGEVISIVNRYLEKNHRKQLILEGRKETLNPIHADFRIELKLKDSTVLGKRRAAQKLASFLDSQSDRSGSLDDLLRDHYR